MVSLASSHNREVRRELKENANVTVKDIMEFVSCSVTDIDCNLKASSHRKTLKLMSSDLTACNHSNIIKDPTLIN